ncbi:MAG: hypothetical protein PUF52_00425 [Prevotella sp.]|nr:hypothetical protein [Prevotella sp.]
MKKNYITPEIDVIQPEDLCDGGIVTASVFKGSTNGECISNFDVVNEDKTKTEYEGLWGESNSGMWGDD